MKTPWTLPQILRAGIQFAQRYNRLPVTQDCRQAQQLPSASTVCKYWHGLAPWHAAILAVVPSAAPPVLPREDDRPEEAPGTRKLFACLRCEQVRHELTRAHRICGHCASSAAYAERVDGTWMNGDSVTRLQQLHVPYDDWE